MSKNFPDDLEYCAVIDNTEYINESLAEVLDTFKEALMLVIIIVFIFLQSWRATLIPVLAIPVSLVGTFATFILLGFTINTLTLFAMVLAIGLVVDDAIVVIENVEHHMKHDGLNPVEATEVAMDEVQGPVVAIAFVLSAVFIPVAFLGGITGVLYKQFALTIAVSMGLSAFIALTLTPALCALLMKPHNPDAKKNFIDKIFDRFNNWFDRTQKKYTGAVGWFIRHAKIGVAMMLVICALTVAAYKVLPSTFVPNEDSGYFIAAVSLPEGTSLNRTYELMGTLSDEIKQVPGVLNVMKIAGYDALSSGSKPNSGALFVGLTTWGERTTKELSITNIIQEVNKLGKKHPEATIMAIQPPALPGLGMIGGWSMELLDMTGYSDKELDDIAKRIVAAANQRPELQRVRTTYSINSPICNFELNREKAKQLGVSFSDVYTALQTNFGGSQIGDFMQFGRNYKIMLQSDAQYRSEAEALKFTYVRNRAGDMVPLETLLSSKYETSPANITRFNGSRNISIQGSNAQGYSSGQAIAAMEEVVHEVVPTGFSIEWSGQSREEKKSAGSTMQVLALALVFVFLCLAALYESWSVPFAVLLTIPTGIFGAFFIHCALFMGLAALGSPNPSLMNSVYMNIGVVMIIGLAAKNAILIVEFAKVRTDKGMDAKKATVEAAGLRLRPIIMTSLAFIKSAVKINITRRVASNLNYKQSFDNTLRFSYPLYSGGKNENNIASAQLNLNSADLNLENTKQQVVFDTTSAYYDVLRNKNLVNVKENTVDLLQKHLDQVVSRFQIGVVAGSDILSSKVQLANAVQSLVTSQNNYDNALATLSNLIGLPLSDDLLIEDNMSYQKIVVNLQDCTDYALKHRPDGISALYAVKKAEKDIAVVKANRLPQVNAQVSKTFNGEKPFDKDHNDNWAAGLSISWNVFDNNVTSAQVQENEATLRRLQSVYEQTREQIELDVRKAYNNLIASEKNILTTQVAVKQAEEEYKIAQVKYDEGVGTNLEVMDAQEKLTESQTNFFTALYNYNVSKAQLDKAMGVPIYIDVILYDESVQNGKSPDLALRNSILDDEN